MFEFAKLIHEALGIESTWAVVMVTALIFALVGGGAGWLVDSQYKHALVAQAPKADDKSTGRIRQLLVDGNEIVRVCQSVPNPYQTPASTRADLANQIVEFQNRAETVLSMDDDPRVQKMWRGAVLYAAPEKNPSIALYCTQLNVKMDVLNRILKRKLTTRQQLRGQLDRFIREGDSLWEACARSEANGAKSLDDRLNWITKVLQWLGDNFDETYQDQFNSVAPETDERWENYSAPVKGPCERMKPRIDVLKSIYNELGTT